MRIDVSFLPALAAAFLLVFARIGTMIMLLPGFGEIGLIEGIPRTATVRAAGEEARSVSTKQQAYLFVQRADQFLAQLDERPPGRRPVRSVLHLWSCVPLHCQSSTLQGAALHTPALASQCACDTQVTFFW